MKKEIEVNRNPYGVACSLGSIFDKCFDEHIRFRRRNFKFILWSLVKCDGDDNSKFFMKIEKVIDDYIPLLGKVNKCECLDRYMNKLISECGLGMDECNTYRLVWDGEYVNDEDRYDDLVDMLMGILESCLNECDGGNIINEICGRLDKFYRDVKNDWLYQMSWVVDWKDENRDVVLVDVEDDEGGDYKIEIDIKNKKIGYV